MGQEYTTKYDTCRHVIDLNYLTASIAGKKAEFYTFDIVDIFEFEFTFLR